MPVPVVCGALVGIAQYLVGLARLFEFLFCGVVAGIAIRMILQRHLAIGALQLLVTGFPRYAQYLVVICFAHAQCLFFLLFRVGNHAHQRRPHQTVTQLVAAANLFGDRVVGQIVPLHRPRASW